MSDPVLINRDGPVTIITINRPERRNAVNQMTAEALREAWLSFDADPEARVGVLTGEGGNFCAGADLNEIELLDADGDDGPLGFTRILLNKPTIAAVAGYAVAGGLEIACWCDMRIADETAIFGGFQRRFGVPLVDGGTQRLPRIVGLGRALELILTGRPVHADEAKTIGLANEVVPPGEHLIRAIELAKMIAGFPQAAVRNDRLAVYYGIGFPLPEGFKVESKYGMDTLHSGEAFDGARKFVEGKGRG